MKLPLYGGPLDGNILSTSLWVAGLAVRVEGKLHWYVSLGDSREPPDSQGGVLLHWRDSPDNAVFGDVQLEGPGYRDATLRVLRDSLASAVIDPRKD
jgi:hypothetical protein